MDQLIAVDILGYSLVFGLLIGFLLMRISYATIGKIYGKDSLQMNALAAIVLFTNNFAICYLLGSTPTENKFILLITFLGLAGGSVYVCFFEDWKNKQKITAET